MARSGHSQDFTETSDDSGEEYEVSSEEDSADSAEEDAFQHGLDLVLDTYGGCVVISACLHEAWQCISAWEHMIACNIQMHICM